MTGNGPAPDENDPPTSAWLTDRLAAAYSMSAEDRAAIAELRAGTAMLVAVGGPTVGERVLMWRPTITVGRDDLSAIWLSSPSVSRQHAMFVQTDTGYDVEDAGSLNGTFVNHEGVHRASLHPGDEVQFGTCRFVYFPGTR